MEQSRQERHWIFIDNSNVIIEGWKYYAQKNKLIPGIQQDRRMRLEMSKLVDHITPENSRAVYLYVSEPPPMETVSDAIMQQNIEVCLLSTHKSSKFQFNT